MWADCRNRFFHHSHSSVVMEYVHISIDPFHRYQHFLTFDFVELHFVSFGLFFISKIWVCKRMCVYICMYVCMYVCMNVRMYVRTYVWMYVYMYVCLYVLCMYVCMCVYTYVCMYACMYMQETFTTRYVCCCTWLYIDACATLNAIVFSIIHTQTQCHICVRESEPSEGQTSKVFTSVRQKERIA